MYMCSVGAGGLPSENSKWRKGDREMESSYSDMITMIKHGI